MKLLVQNSSRTKDKITDSMVEAVFDVTLTDYDEDWLETTSESWIKWRNFDKSLIDGIEYVKTANVTPEKVESIISKFRDLINERNKLNFDKDLGLDFFNPEHHVQHTSDKISSGYSFIDRVTSGGYDPSSLIVYAGEQNVGKCSTYSQYITIKNKRTSEIHKIKIGDFFKLVKKENEKK
jgi:hypothetical protein